MTKRAIATGMSTLRSTAPHARRPSPSAPPTARNPRTSPASKPPVLRGGRLQLARELDDAILSMRTNALDIGIWLVKTAGDPSAVLEVDATLARHAEHWLVRETVGFLRRTLARLDVSSRTLFALVESGSCFAGTLLELALAADRIYMQRLPDDAAKEPRLARVGAEFRRLPDAERQEPTRPSLSRRRSARSPRCAAPSGELLPTQDALRLGLVTSAPDDLDWDDEIRIALEERASMSPDALTGMEANLRFGGAETMETRIFGRLSAWQNWIFNRPNAVGERGALKVYGKGGKAQFDFERV